MNRSARERLAEAGDRLRRPREALGEAPRAKKSLGQHFLNQPAICQRIAGLLRAGEDDAILEIGPGPGALTREIEALPHRRLVLIEKDAHWAKVRQEEGEARTEVLCQDALAYPWEALEGPWKLAGNLPYNVASPLLWDIAARCRALSRAVFMVQKEVGERIAASPCTRDYGALSVWMQAHLACRMEFTVGPGCFTPPPKVDSAVLSFDPLPEHARPSRPELLASLLRLCFQQRRKQLGGVFRRQGREDLLQRLDMILDPVFLGLGFEPLNTKTEVLSALFIDLDRPQDASLFGGRTRRSEYEKMLSGNGNYEGDVMLRPLTTAMLTQYENDSRSTASMKEIMRIMNKPENRAYFGVRESASFHYSV
ncbi:MAG: ribosomal RNA small subunit methyltransferase A [Desulfovibrio sp.]|nr:ribosomal RNA small subunit methyltransferase A [Desulfovibrio sp.]